MPTRTPTIPRPHRTLLWLLLLPFLFGLLTPPLPAGAAAGYTPRVGTHFTNPPSGKPDNYANDLTTALRNVPCPSYRRGPVPKGQTRPVIAASEYHLTQQAPVDVLDAKSACGVAVWFLTFTRDKKPLSHGKVDELKRDLRGDPWSWVKVCHNACGRGGDTGINHMKLWALSRTGNTSNVVFTGSGNLSGDTDRAAFNQWTVLFNRDLYAAARNCVAALRADRALPVCKPGTYRDPRTHRTIMRLEFTRDANDLVDVLKATRCTRGVSQVRLPQWGATIPDAVKQIKRLDDAGCDTRVIGNASTWYGGAKDWRVGGKKVDALHYLAATGTAVWEARQTASCHRSGLYLHEKAVTFWRVPTIPGGYLNISGSRNLTKAKNDDQTLWYYSRGAAQQQIVNFNALTKRTCRLAA